MFLTFSLDFGGTVLDSSVGGVLSKFKLLYFMIFTKAYFVVDS